MQTIPLSNDHSIGRRNYRAAHGLLFFKEMDVDTFLGHARQLEKSMEGV